MLLLWGDTGIVLYNDRCIPLLAGRHPALMGTAAKLQHSHRKSQLPDIMQVVASGDSVIAEDDWLCPPRSASDTRRLQLGYAPLGNGHGEITGVWIQVLPENGFGFPLANGSVEQMLPASVAAAGVASWLWSPAAGRVSLSSGAARVLGLTAEHPRTLPSFDFELVHPLDRAARRQTLEQAAIAATSFASEFRIVRPCDDQIAWVEERGRALRDPETGEVSLNAVLWEVTNRKHPPNHGSRPNGIAPLELETVGLAFFANDGRITEANSTYIALFGLEAADLAAGLVRRGDGTAPEWRTLTYRTVDEFNHTGRIAPHEKECIRPDGYRWWGLFGAHRISETEGVEYVVDISSGMRA
jgi:PAS domain-containing protein